MTDFEAIEIFRAIDKTFQSYAKKEKSETNSAILNAIVETEEEIEKAMLSIYQHSKGESGFDSEAVLKRYREAMNK